MTNKVYKSAMGVPVDLGALLLQNEQVRAVGNMGVNAAGDLVDSTNKVIDKRNKQVQRQYRKQTNVSDIPVATSNLDARKTQKYTQKSKAFHESADSREEEQPLDLDPPAMQETVSNLEATVPAQGGLASAIARSREIKQELEKTRRQQQQEQGLRKI